ncbi:MAG: porin family protein [Gemmatimonadota bacterium]|nr:MAG: porin family protein [Gemmatimonadota bacterium]
MRKALLAVVLVLFAASPALAQNPIELGADLGFWYSSTGKIGETEFVDVTTIALPVAFRAGFFLNDNISIEPSAGVYWYKESDDGTEISFMTFLADVLYHFNTSGDTQFFVHGGGGINVVKGGEGGESESNLQFGFDGGAGVKFPIVERLFFRLGGRVLYLLENDKDEFPRASSFNIIGTLGLSMMTM